MTLGEKSAALTGPDNLKPNSIGQNGKAGLSGSVSQNGIYSFSEIVDSACEKLMDVHIRHSIRRIREMDEQLCLLERELDEFLSKKDKG